MSTRCPSCAARVPAGETICMDCGTELVIATDDAPAAAPEPAAPARPVAPVVPEPVAAVPCPDCGERVRSDANGLCPVCGHDFAAPVEIDEAEFFREPPSLDEARRAATGAAPSARAASQTREPSARSSSSAASASPSPSAQPRRSAPLPADRVRTRFRGGTGAQLAVEEAGWLVVEGGQSVFFEGRMVDRLRLDVDELLIGRRDPSVGHYPDIDLTHFVHIDRHISRRHARVLRVDGRWFIEDLCDNDATWLNDRAHALNRDRAELTDGDRILVSDSIAMVFRTRAPS